MNQVIRLSCLMLLCFTQALAQQVPLGQWQTHFCYNNATSVEKVGDKIFAARTSLYFYSPTENEYTTYSKVNGLSDVNIKLIRYDESTDNLLIIYENGNIDLMQQQNVVNISDIKNLNITGSKRINSVYFKNKLMYLSTDFGIVVLNPIRQEVKESYVLQEASEIFRVNGLVVNNGYFYAATSNGIYRADEQSNSLQNFASWTLVNNTPMQSIFTHNAALFCVSANTVYTLSGSTLNPTYVAQAPITSMRQGATDIYVCERSKDRRAIGILNASGQIIDSVFLTNPNDVVEYSPNEIWVADEWFGLTKLANRKDRYLHNPNGIYSSTVYKMTPYNDEMYVSAGSEIFWLSGQNPAGISKFKNGTWTYYNKYVGTPGMDTVIDIVDVAIDKRNGFIYGASFGNGLIEIRPDGTTSTYQNNGYVQGQIGNPGSYRLSSLTFDDDHNLWFGNYSATEQLAVKKADGSWQKFSFPYTVSEKATGVVVVDNINQKWLTAPRGIGVFVLNDNNTIDNKNDDKIRYLTTGEGNGNLPNNEVTSMAKDKNGKIWIGTANGIGIINCPENIMNANECDGELKIVKYDLNAGLLFQRESVNTIAVDGANNKWIGTNNGVWLISDDAEKILQRFTSDNSPLPSNEVKTIAIQPLTGDVFIATNAGLVSYRADATEASETNKDLLVFPNPVPSQYPGIIAVKGLVENADVRITDAAGQLVYRTKAQGGQAVWNGKNYLGERPHTGVYYVFVTNTDGSQTGVGKFIFNE